MGTSMCGHVLRAGYPVAVHTRTKAKAESLLESGADWADSPCAVANDSDVVFTIVGFPDDVREVYLGADGVIGAVRAGMILVDMTTTSPSLAVEIAQAAADRGAAAIDAPVSGGDVGAKNASLSIMVGGDQAAVTSVMPILETMGKTIVHQGGPGSGQHAKMCNQIVIASTMVGMCEALIYGHRAGLDLETMLSSIRGGAAGCWSLDNYAPRILRRDFAPGFFVDHFVKDMGIALDQARRMKLSLPGLALANQLYQSVQAHGRGRSGTQALMIALESMSNISND